jgi:hypothetical protein
MPIRYLPFLRLATLGFLSAPWFIFMVTWMRPAWAVACVLMFVAVIYAYGRQSRASTMPELADDLLPTRERIPVGTLMLLLAVAVAWVSVSGAGGVGLQNLPDWNNKNVLMRDLLDKPWPVVYEGGLILNYYFALYLPASLVGRLAGWDAAQWFMYGEVLVGTVLALLWVYSFSGRLGVKVLLLFIAFGGLDLIGYRLAWHRMPTWGKSIEWWVSTLQFSSNSTLLYWVPQHCLSGWLLTALMLDEASRMRRVAFIGLFLSLCALWSPFVTIGLAPIALLVIYLAKGKSLGSFANFVFLPVVAILMYALYAPHKAGSDVDAGLAVWARHYSPSSMFRTFVFLTLEIGVYLALVATCWKSLDRSWRAIAVTVAVSSLLWVLARWIQHARVHPDAAAPLPAGVADALADRASPGAHRDGGMPADRLRGGSAGNDTLLSALPRAHSRATPDLRRAGARQAAHGRVHHADRRAAVRRVLSDAGGAGQHRRALAPKATTRRRGCPATRRSPRRRR